jgi:hypothetical protein
VLPNLIDEANRRSDLNSDGRIELAFGVSNRFEETYKVDAFDITRDENAIYEAWSEPRTYGVALSLNW